jgi:hypothetical protein
MKNENLSFWLDILKIAIGVVLAVVGWIVGYRLASRNTREQKRRDLTTEHLISAYRILTNEISHRKETPERSLKMENILSDIQLFGSPFQVEMAKRLADEVANGGEFQLDPLINSLRDDLRNELKLSPVNGNVKWLRLNHEAKDSTASQSKK